MNWICTLLRPQPQPAGKVEKFADGKLTGIDSTPDGIAVQDLFLAGMGRIKILQLGADECAVGPVVPGYHKGPVFARRHFVPIDREGSCSPGSVCDAL